MPGRLTYWLIGSAVLNAALLGVTVGGLAKPKPAPVAVASPSADGPRVSAEVQAAWAKLSEADRKELWREFGELRQRSAPGYARMQDAARRIAEIARTEPFDEEALQDALVVYRHMQVSFQQGVDDVLVSHLSKMPPEAREIAARGLLTPYSQWMRPRRDTSSASSSPAPKPAPSAAKPAG